MVKAMRQRQKSMGLAGVETPGVSEQAWPADHLGIKLPCICAMLHLVPPEYPPGMSIRQDAACGVE